jgi:hypothetical protein
MAQGTRSYLDGTGATKTALTGGNGTSDSTGVTVFDINGTPLGVALDGTDATGVVMAPGGAGIRGWLATIAGALAGTVKAQLQAGSAVIGAVTQSGGPWSVADAADGAVTPGSAGTSSMLAGLYFSGAALPAPSAGQQVAAQSDGAGRLVVASSLASPNVVTLNPANTAAAYAATQSLGGLLVFANALPTGKGTIESVELFVASGDTPVVTGTFYLFDTVPGSTVTDHAGVVIAANDAAKLIGSYSIATVADPSGASVPAVGSSLAGSTNTGRKLVAAGNTSIWGVFVMNSATTFTGTRDVTFRLKTLTY